MKPPDAEAVAALHHAAMGSSLWARLGRPFLAALYRSLMEQPEFLGFVYREEGRILGFIAGTTDTRSLLPRTFARSWWRLLLPFLLGVARNPSVLVPLLSTPAYVARLDEVPAESLFCSFVPDLRGRRVSGHANKVLFDELAHRGHRAVRVTTEADNAGALRQLTSWGFEERGEFTFYGKRMKAFLLEFQDHPRVEPVTRW